MHFHLPKPLHGWREFVGEVGIIVVGVMIALGAEQVVETLHWREEVGTFRTAVRREIGHNLGGYVFRAREDRCVKRRLDELAAWLAGWEAGRPRPLVRPIGIPLSLSLETSAWQSRGADIVSHLPIEEKMSLGQLYDEFANNEVHRLDERQTWLSLADYDGARSLDHQDLMRLHGLITRARFRDVRMRDNDELILKIGRRMGLGPTDNDFPPYGADFCRSLFADGRRGTTLTN